MSSLPRKITRGRGGTRCHPPSTLHVSVSSKATRARRRDRWRHGPTHQRHHPRRRPTCPAPGLLRAARLEAHVHRRRHRHVPGRTDDRVALEPDAARRGLRHHRGRRLGRLHARLRRRRRPARSTSSARSRRLPARRSRAHPSTSRSATPASSPTPTATPGRSPTSRRLTLNERRNGGDPVMSWDELHDYCMSMPGATETFPFEPASPCSRPRAARCSPSPPSRRPPTDVTVKCDPAIGEALRAQFASIVPGYHLNKRHWITITIGGDVPDDGCASSSRTATSSSRARATGADVILGRDGSVDDAVDRHRGRPPTGRRRRRTPGRWAGSRDRGRTCPCGSRSSRGG